MSLPFKKDRLILIAVGLLLVARLRRLLRSRHHERLIFHLRPTGRLTVLTIIMSLLVMGSCSCCFAISSSCSWSGAGSHRVAVPNQARPDLPRSRPSASRRALLRRGHVDPAGKRAFSDPVDRSPTIQADRRRLQSAAAQRMRAIRGPARG